MDAEIVESSLIVIVEYQRITHYETSGSVNCCAAPIALKVGISNHSIFVAEYAEATANRADQRAVKRSSCV